MNKHFLFQGSPLSFGKSLGSQEDSLKNFFSQIPKNLIEQLYSAYKIDFEMFNYSRPDDIIAMGLDSWNYFCVSKYIVSKRPTDAFRRVFFL